MEEEMKRMCIVAVGVVAVASSWHERENGEMAVDEDESDDGGDKCC